jgi:hypothetical protein
MTPDDVSLRTTRVATAILAAELHALTSKEVIGSSEWGGAPPNGPPDWKGSEVTLAR